MAINILFIIILYYYDYGYTPIYNKEFIEWVIFLF